MRYNTAMVRFLTSALTVWVLLAPMPGFAQSASVAPSGRGEFAPADETACDDDETDCGPDEVCQDGVCVPRCSDGCEPELAVIVEPKPAPVEDDVPIVGFVGSVAGGPMLFAFGSDPMGLAVVAGGGIRLSLSRMISIPIRFDARYVLTEAGPMYSYQPSAGIRVDFGAEWLSLTGGFCRWPKQSDLFGGRAMVADRVVSSSGISSYDFHSDSHDMVGGHIAVRFGWQAFTLDGGIDIFGGGTVQYLAVGVGL